MLSASHPICHYDLGATRLLYTRCPRTGIVEFSCIPTSCIDTVVPFREFDTGLHIDHLPKRWLPCYAHEPEWLTPFKTSCSPYPNGFTANQSMRTNRDMLTLRLQSHHATPTRSGGLCIETVLQTTTYLQLIHRVHWDSDDAFFRVEVEVQNIGAQPLTIEYLPSFSLGRITPFENGEAIEHLKLHRFRSTWSAEGRHESQLLEDLSLDRSWAGNARRSERFGQLGSMPVRSWFPWVAMEDIHAGVFWGAQLSTPGSWHIEVSRLKDKVTLSGGLPSRDFGEWWITLQPKEIFTTPQATLACVAGNLDTLCHALTSAQKQAAASHPTETNPLPFIYNDWCATWGEPNHDLITSTAEILAQHQVADVVVIDDGWAYKPAGGDIQNNGDWIVDTTKFQNGLSATTKAIREKGLIPGIWFEYECATEGTEAFKQTSLQLHRDHQVIQVGSRHFWDLRHVDAQAYLAERVIDRLRNDGFGYIKIDYNDCLPVGIDGPSSPGENLRQHLLAVQRFVQRLKQDIPHIYIENCSSGGFRLEPSFQALSALGQFSDAHETLAIPIIAANLHRLLLPQQLQVWCVIHAEDPIQRLHYSLAAILLGVPALSGDMRNMPLSHFRKIAEARQLHHQATSVIRHGFTQIYRNLSPSWNEPKGWQVVVRSTTQECLVVTHTFALTLPKTREIPLPNGTWKIKATFGDSGFDNTLSTISNPLHLNAVDPFSGGAILLERI